MDQTIEPKISPLVDALNALPGVRTIASCQGHVTRISRPYVYFHCPPAVAEAMAARLHDLNMQDDTLSYWWHLTGAFNGEHRLCFSLKAPDLDHRRGFLKTFLNYVVFRKKIDDDLRILADTLNKALDDAGDNGRKNTGQIGSIERDGGGDGDAQAESRMTPLPSRDTPERIGLAAIRALAFDAGRNGMSTMVARWRSDHGLSFPSFKTAWNLTRISLAVVFLALTLGACASREIQKDGAGTDEMQKSPCACLPVPYQAPSFTWGRG